MRILLTGAAGFIGSHTAEFLLRRGEHVVGYDNFNTFYDPAIKRRNAALLARTGGERFSLVEADLLDERALEQVFHHHTFDAVIHLAAWAGVRPSIQHPERYVDSNIRGTMNVLEQMRKHRVAKLVYASSSSVYGGRTNVPFRETDPVDNPISPYAASKKATEVLCYTWHHLYGMHAAGLRYFTVYGPRQRPEMAIHHFATLLSAGKPVPMFGDGTSARDYTFIDDIVQGTVAALDRSVGYEIYNLGEERTTTLRELVHKLAEALGVEAKIEQRENQPGDVPLTCADVAKAKRLLGYTPSVPIEEGLARFAAWFKQQER